MRTVASLRDGRTEERPQDARVWLMRLISQAIPKRSPEEIRGKPDASDEWTEETHRRIDFLANLVRMVNSDARVASDQAAVLEKHIDRILEQYPEDQQDFWFLRLVGVLNQLRG